jgi:iron-sulfur cluster assembly accessory protein
MTQIIKGDELIGDILNRFPESAQIMNDFGLHCTSCSVNAFEPLRLGALSHGLTEETVDNLIAQINNLANSKRKAPLDGIYLTERAAKKVAEFAKAEEKEGFGLQIVAKDNGGNEPAYAMDFKEKADKDEKTFKFHGIEVYLGKESFKNMQGAEIDFLETQYGSGFKIDNPLFKAEEGGCCSTDSSKKGGCGCGTGKGSGGCGQEGGCGC